jgi:hypothetical protein
MEKEFRVKKTNIGCFPQVRFKGILFWSAWKKIGKHVTGFGLYDEDDYNHPKTEQEAQQIIEDYKNFQVYEIKDTTSVKPETKLYTSEEVKSVVKDIIKSADFLDFTPEYGIGGWNALEKLMNEKIK